MKQSRVEAMRAQALSSQADTVSRLEESVQNLIVKVDDILAVVTEIRESLQVAQKGKAKPQKDAAASE